MSVIEFRGITKIFRLAHEPRRSLKDSLVKIFKPRKYEKFKALDNVSFKIEKGEFVSFIGSNGCGKSTLLKILAGIYKPTSGSVMVREKVTPFIELGIGFDGELTARENIYLYGAILGLSRRQVTERFDKIVEFSELERFIDTPLRSFSSGMQVRLAFATAIQSESPILIFDEVLAVGDASFQEKCFDYFDKIRQEKKTIIFVSHQLASVEEFSDRVFWIKDGKIVMEGSPNVVVSAYESSLGAKDLAKREERVKKEAAHLHRVAK